MVHKHNPYSIEFKLDRLPKTVNALQSMTWKARHGHSTRWKRSIWRAVWPFKPSAPLNKAKITLIRVSAKEPDYDGLVGSFKCIIDGLREVGVLADDKSQNIGIPTYLWEKTNPSNGHIKIKVEAVDPIRELK